MKRRLITPEVKEQLYADYLALGSYTRVAFKHKMSKATVCGIVLQLGGRKRKLVEPGERFSRLVTVRRTRRYHNGWKWLVRCDCGTEKEVAAAALTGGLTRSCGCLHAEHGQRLRMRALERIADFSETADDVVSYGVIDDDF